MGVAPTKDAQPGQSSERAAAHSRPSTPANVGRSPSPSSSHGGVATVAHEPERSRTIAIVTRTVLGVALLGFAGAAAQYMAATRPPPEKKPVEESTFSVLAIEAPQFVVAQRFGGYGTVRAMVDADVAAEVGGIVVDRPGRIEEGALVGKGDRIVLLERSDYAQRLISAEQRVASLDAELESIEIQRSSLGAQVSLTSEQTELARKDYSRELDAREKGAHNDINVEQVLSALLRYERDLEMLRVQLAGLDPQKRSLEAQRASAQADVALARRNLERTDVVSPIAGSLQMVDARVGEQMTMGRVVARVVDLSRVEIPVHLPMSARNLVRVGDRIEIVAGSWVGASVESRWDASIARVSPEADTLSRTIIAYVVIDQDSSGAGGRVLVPGQFVEATATSSSSQHRVVIPRTAIDGEHVFVADTDGLVSQRRVVVAFTVDAKDLPDLFEHIRPTEHHITQWAVVDRGVEKGERVILSNLSQMVAGAHVNVSIGGDIHSAVRPEAAKPEGASEPRAIGEPTTGGGEP